MHVLNQKKAERSRLKRKRFYLAQRLTGWTTNLAGAIQLGLNLTTGGEGRQRRLVVLSDGIQNVGEAADLLDLVRASEIEVFTLPLSSEREYEVWVRELRTPSQVRTGEIFPVRAIVETTTDTEVPVRLYRNDIPVKEPQMIALKPGKQPIDSDNNLRRGCLRISN